MPQDLNIYNIAFGRRCTRVVSALLTSYSVAYMSRALYESPASDEYRMLWDFLAHVGAGVSVIGSLSIGNDMLIKRVTLLTAGFIAGNQFLGLVGRGEDFSLERIVAVAGSGLMTVGTYHLGDKVYDKV